MVQSCTQLYIVIQSCMFTLFKIDLSSLVITNKFSIPSLSTSQNRRNVSLTCSIVVCSDAK